MLRACALLTIAACGSTPIATDGGIDAAVVKHDASCQAGATFTTPRPWLLRAQQSAVFWEDFGNGVDANGSIGEIDACGHQTMISSYDVNPRGLAAADGVVCWVSIGAALASYQNDGYLGCASASTKRAINEPSPRPTGAIAIYEGDVYWARDDGSIAAAPLNAGASRVVVTGQAFGVWPSLVVQQSTVYFTTSTAVRAVPTTGGSASDVVAGVEGIDLVGDGTSLFFGGWSQQIQGIYRIDTNQVALLATTSKLGNEIAVDATDVYYEDDMKVMKVAKSGSSATFVASSTDGYAIAVDDSYVYVGGGGVTRIPKP